MREPAHRFLARAAVVIGVALLSVAILSETALARSKRLRPPPDVDLDPDRAMSFGRLSKSPFDRSISHPISQSISPGLVMDPSVEPYASPIKPSRYEPQTGEIRGGLVDKRREMAQREEADRPTHAASPAGLYKPRRVKTAGGQYERPPTPLSPAGLRPLNPSVQPSDFQTHQQSSLSLLPQ